MLIARAAIALIVAVAVGAFLAAGALSNWFRHGFSLEAAFAFVPVMVAACLAIMISVFAVRRRRLVLLVLACGIAAAGVLAFSVAHLHAFGTRFPKARAGHTFSSGIATLQMPGGPIRYELRLHEPFARSHKEVLVVTRADVTQVVEVPVFDGPAGGFGDATDPHDWVILTATEDPNVFRLDVGKSLLVDKSFLVDIRNSRATTLGMRTQT